LPLVNLYCKERERERESAWMSNLINEQWVTCLNRYLFLYSSCYSQSSIGSDSCSISSSKPCLAILLKQYLFCSIRFVMIALFRKTTFKFCVWLIIFFYIFFLTFIMFGPEAHSSPSSPGATHSPAAFLHFSSTPTTRK
jgi:hypothetical protein